MSVEILQGDCLEVLRTLPAESVNCCVTSPPYFGLRDYGCDGQIGLESSVGDFINKLTAVFQEVKRVLRPDGTLWMNLGDTYNHDSKWGGSSSNKNELKQGYARKESRERDSECKGKDLLGIPWLMAFSLRNHGWYLRQDIIWHKPNPMPESVSDRCTKAHEYIFLLSKSAKYYFNQQAILEPASPNTHARLSQDLERQIGSERAHAGGKTNGNMKAVGRRKMPEVGSGVKNNESFNSAVCLRVDERNKRSVWTVTTKPYKGAHFATFPPDLIKPCILAGCPEGGTVLDPFFGSGTTGQVATECGCNCIGIELNPEYVKLAKRRNQQRSLLA